MRPSTKLLVLSTAMLALCTAASATTPESVISVKGIVVVMRGNSVHQLSVGDKIQSGDRIIATSGSSATFSGGGYLSSGSSAVSKNGGDELQFISKTNEASKSFGSSSSKIFSMRGSDHDEPGGKNSNDDRGSRGGGHPWFGDPKDSESIGN